MYDPQTNVYNPAGNLTTNPLGLNTSVTYNGSATPPTNAGSYAVIATITDPNYTGNTAGTFVIAKATPVAAAGLHRQGKSRAHLPSQMLTAECRGPGRRGGGEFAAETPGREARHQLFFSKAGNDDLTEWYAGAACGFQCRGRAADR